MTYYDYIPLFATSTFCRPGITWAILEHLDQCGHGSSPQLQGATAFRTRGLLQGKDWLLQVSKSFENILTRSCFPGATIVF